MKNRAGCDVVFMVFMDGINVFYIAIALLQNFVSYSAGARDHAS